MISVLVVSNIYYVPCLVFTKLRHWALEFRHLCIILVLDVSNANITINCQVDSKMSHELHYSVIYC